MKTGGPGVSMTTVLPQALKAANASEEDTFPEPREYAFTSPHVGGRFSGRGVA